MLHLIINTINNINLLILTLLIASHSVFIATSESYFLYFISFVLKDIILKLFLSLEMFVFIISNEFIVEANIVSNINFEAIKCIYHNLTNNNLLCSLSSHIL